MRKIRSQAKIPLNTHLQDVRTERIFTVTISYVCIHKKTRIIQRPHQRLARELAKPCLCTQFAGVLIAIQSCARQPYGTRKRAYRSSGLHYFGWPIYPPAALCVFREPAPSCSVIVSLRPSATEIVRVVGILAHNPKIAAILVPQRRVKLSKTPPRQKERETQSFVQLHSVKTLPSTSSGTRIRLSDALWCNSSVYRCVHISR